MIITNSFVGKEKYISYILRMSTTRVFDPKILLNNQNKNNGYFISNWVASDTLEQFNKNLSNDKERLIKLGYVDLHGNAVLDKVLYKVNKQGFRGNHWTKTPGIVCFGCSNTYGTGVNQDESWPEVLGKLLDTPVYNLGMPAFGLNAILYYALNWLDEDIPNPTAFFVLEPPPGRSTILNLDKEELSILLNLEDKVKNKYKLEFLNILEGTGEITDASSVAILELIAKSKGIPFYIQKNTVFGDYKDSLDVARDLVHPGPRALKGVAQNFANLFNKKINVDNPTNLPISKDAYSRLLFACSTGSGSRWDWNEIKENSFYSSSWCIVDSFKRLEENIKDTKSRKKLISLGYITKHAQIIDNITYKINRNGFRGDVWSGDPGIVCFGCSNTYGLGVDQKTTWPEVLGKLLGSPVYNLGLPGKGLDAILYYALHFMHQDIPNPTAFFVLEPPPGRSLIYNKETERLAILRKIFDDKWMDDKHLVDLGGYVTGTGHLSNLNTINTLKLIAKIKTIPFYMISSHEFNNNFFNRKHQAVHLARDLSHPNSFIHYNIAKHFAKLHK